VHLRRVEELSVRRRRAALAGVGAVGRRSRAGVQRADGVAHVAAVGADDGGRRLGADDAVSDEEEVAPGPRTYY
jgi:hypothetical protein